MKHLIIKNFWGKDKNLIWNEDGMFQREGCNPLVPSILMFSKLMFFLLHRILHLKQESIDSFEKAWLPSYHAFGEREKSKGSE